MKNLISQDNVIDLLNFQEKEIETLFKNIGEENYGFLLIIQSSEISRELRRLKDKEGKHVEIFREVLVKERRILKGLLKMLGAITWQTVESVCENMMMWVKEARKELSTESETLS